MGSCIDKKGTPQFQECVDQKLGKGLSIETVEELTATKVSFERPEEVYQQELAKVDTQYPIPYDVKLESLEKPVNVRFSCAFKIKDEEIQGEILPVREVEVYGPEIRKRISCKPAGTERYSPGSYKVVFNAIIDDITTISFLDRILIGSDITRERRSEILSQRSLRELQGSRAGEEFAAYYFEIGTRETFILTDLDPVQTLTGRVKNLKNGEVLSVKKLEIDLRDPSIYPGVLCFSQGFEYKGNTMIWKRKGDDTTTPDVSCQLNFPLELTGLGKGYEQPEFIHKQFKAYLTYAYLVKKEDRFEVVST